MKRKKFYIEYYNRTNRNFSDKIIWCEKEREEARRRRQHFTSKLERKIFIAVQYFVLLLCWIPMCIERELWIVVPIALLYFILQSSITDFSILKIEALYFIYRKNNVYSSVLHNIFLGNYDDFLNQLTRFTKNEVTGFVFTSGGRFYGKFRAVCRNKSKRILLKFKINSVVITINKKKFVISGMLTSNEQLISEIATIIKTNK